MVNGKIIKQAKNFNCLGYDMSHKDDKDQIPKRSQSVCVGGGGAIKRGLKTRKAWILRSGGSPCTCVGFWELDHEEGG